MVMSFTPRVIATYEKAFRYLASQVLDNVLPLGEFDLVTEIARELPIRLLCRLLGVPEADADRVPGEDTESTTIRRYPSVESDLHGEVGDPLREGEFTMHGSLPVLRGGHGRVDE